jgi:hypothetical protein
VGGKSVATLPQKWQWINYSPFQSSPGFGDLDCLFGLAGCWRIMGIADCRMAHQTNQPRALHDDCGLAPSYVWSSPCAWAMGSSTPQFVSIEEGRRRHTAPPTPLAILRLPAVGTLKRYSKALQYEYRVKIAALGTLKRYSILSLTLYLE